MNKGLLGAAALVLVAMASAQAQNSRFLETAQTDRTPSLQGKAEAAVPESPALLTFGGIGVHLWAPVEPHYDANANRNFAADPLWEADRGAAPSGF